MLPGSMNPSTLGIHDLAELRTDVPGVEVLRDERWEEKLEELAAEVREFCLAAATMHVSKHVGHRRIGHLTA